MSDQHEKKLRALVYIAKKDAADRKESAGYSGEFGDRGASQLEAEIVAFISGLNKVIPPSWGKYEQIYKTSEQEKDKEYETYIRLKKKFE